jgi:hypothetical protein
VIPAPVAHGNPRAFRDSFPQPVNRFGVITDYACRMSRDRAIAIAEQAAPFALRVIAAGNLLFLGSFLALLTIAADTARL